MRTRVSVICLLACTMLLAACGQSTPSPEMIQTSIAQTQAALPTQTPIPTPTPIPLSEINLEDILILPGDLPSGYAGSQISNNPPEKIFGYEQFIEQKLEKKGIDFGFVWVVLYNTTQKAKTTYTAWSNYGSSSEEDNFTTTVSSVEGLGEEAKYFMMDGEVATISIDMTYLTFVRCHAFVRINMKTDDVESVINYADRLDKRLSELVCDSE